MKSQSPHRVLLVTPGFPKDEQDSLCIPPVQLLLRSIKTEYPELEISVVTLHYPSKKGPYGWHGCRVRAIGGANRPWPLRMIDLARARRSAESLESGRSFSHIHALWLSDAGLVAQSVARGWSCPLSLTAMGQDVLPTNRYLRRLDRTAGRLVVISDRAGTTLKESMNRDPDKVIPWGIDPFSKNLPPWDARSIDLLGVGSLIELKRWTLLLEVTQHLVQQGTPPRTVLIGDGPLRTALETEALQRGLGDHIEFTGELPRPEVLRLMENSRILLHPSRFEGQGFVFSEALSRGMSIVSDGVGTAVPSERWRITEPDSFASECRDLLRHPPETSCFVPFSLENTVRAYADLWGLDRK